MTSIGPPWHYCILTASTKAQARLYTMELERRRQRGLLPAGTVPVVVADPPGARLGSGGATLWALRALGRTLCHERSSASSAASLADRLRRRRVLILHCGGDSRRAPLHAATGKVFALLPTTCPDGQPAAVFDLLWSHLAPLGKTLPNGILVGSGDVLLDFGSEGITWPRADVVGLAAWGDVTTGTQHGVYAFDADGLTRAYLQKASAAQLRRAGAIAADGRVPIDSGLFLFQGRALKALCALAHERGLRSGPPLDLYTDFVAALLPRKFVGQVCKPDAARLSEALRDCSFAAKAPAGSLFAHLGTTRLFRDRLTRDGAATRLFGLEPSVATHAPAVRLAPSARVIGSELGDTPGRIGSSAIVSEVRAAGELTVEPGAVVSLVSTDQHPLTVRRDTVLFTLPVRIDVDGRRRSGHVAVIHGIKDDPREELASPKCTFLGQPLTEWLAERRVPPQAVWPDVLAGERTLWNARLFPVALRGDVGTVPFPARCWQGRGTVPCSGPGSATSSLALALWMQERQPAEPADRWFAAPRLAFADLASALDAPALLRQRDALAAQVAYHTALRDIEHTGDRHLLGEWRGLPKRALALARRRITAYARSAAHPLHRARAWKLLADTPAADAELRTGLTARDRNRAAFGAVAEAVAPAGCQPPLLRLALDPDQCVVADAPVRVDLAGGWTDTPPYCLEHGGAVVNVAIDLDGRPPIRAIVRPLRERVVRLASEDADACLETSRLKPLLSYDRPGDPLAILKAALFCTGTLSPDPSVPLRDSLDDFGAGIEIRTHCHVPQGSGLGASSILAATIIAAVSRLGGSEPSTQGLVEAVLRLEQMLTAGGGWQDQVGGVVGGVKLTTSPPGVPQQLQIEPLNLAPQVWEELAHRLVLVYTGRTRVAKNILQTVMGRYLSREPKTIAALREIHTLAHEVSHALRAGDLGTVGHLMSAQWECNKVLDPDSTNPEINALFEAVRPHVAGAKLTGAGGGGFMAVMTHRGCPLPPRLRQFGIGPPQKASVNHRGLSIRSEG
ncbi:MAG: hypothetical protein FJX75_22670 [Armatimonadetes bacterium]|nr:hypothetical protein [Armatimonadota bacterium]